MTRINPLTPEERLDRNVAWLLIVAMVIAAGGHLAGFW
jgi:hypothetical protein